MPAKKIVIDKINRKIIEKRQKRNEIQTNIRKKYFFSSFCFLKDFANRKSVVAVRVSINII